MSRETSSNSVRDRIEQHMRECVRTGVWCPGMILPSRRALAKEFDVDLNTLQRAIAPLLADATLCADAGRATFVAQKPPFRVLPSRSIERAAAATSRTNLSGARVGIVTALSIAYCRHTNNYYGYEIVNAIEHHLALKGVSARVCDTSELGRQDIKEADAIRLLSDLAVDAIIVCADPNDDALALAKSLALPIVFLGDRPTHDVVPYVRYDGWNASFRATRHLIEQGCRRVLFYASRSADWVNLRIAGAQAAVAADCADIVEFSLEVCPAPMPMHGLDQTPDAREQVAQILKRNSNFDGVISANDRMALGFLQAARDVGMDAPDDFLLIGFDDDQTVSMQAGISSMRRPAQQMAAKASSLVIEGLAGEEINHHCTFFSHLIVRDTTYRRGPQSSFADQHVQIQASIRR